MTATLRVRITGDARSAQDAMERTGSSLKRLGGLAGAAAAAAGAAMLGLAGTSIRAASEVEQALGGVSSVFGEHAAQVESSARRAAREVGLSTAQYGNLATVLGAQLRNAGTAADQLAPSTDRLIGLGADLAATFGGSAADAVSAVSSLLKGERDPIERYGVSIKAADVSARLAAQGLGGLTGAARTQAEQQATLALLTEQTAAAQGAFGRESDTTAGRAQRLAATVEDLQARFGERLLPAVVAVAGFLLDHALPAADRASDALGKRLGPAVGAVGRFITGTLVPAGRDLYGWFSERIAPQLRTGLVPVLAAVRSAFGSVSGAVDRNRPALRELGNAVRVVAEFMARLAPIAGAVLGGAFRLLGGAITGVLNLFGAIDRAGDRMAASIGRLRTALGNITVPGSLRTIAGWFGGSAAPDVAAAVVTARRAGGGLTAAPGPVPLGATLGGLSLSTGDVHVYVDGQEVRAVVRRELAGWDRALARRVAGGVLA